MANSIIENPHMEDTGWITLNNTYPLFYRVKRGMVTVVLRLAGGATPSEGQVLATLPQKYWPAAQMVCATHNLRGAFSIAQDGAIAINANSASGLTLNNYMGCVITYPYND